MIYLASASPRRRELLTQIGIEFELLKVDVDESRLGDESPDVHVARLAELKATTAADLVQKPWPVLGSDTIVVNEGEILGKPSDKAAAIRTLQKLSGKTHQVKTAICVVVNGKPHTEVVTTQVTFRELSLREIEQYWASGEPADKAGSYGIQGIAGKFVKTINGSYSSVVGLPLMETQRLIHQLSGNQAI